MRLKTVLKVFLLSKGAFPGLTENLLEGSAKVLVENGVDDGV